MSFEKAYSPQQYEADIYAQWEDSGSFKPKEGTKEPFSIIMPPPNANGVLHTGHMMYVLQDLMIRYRRMQGHPTLWLPGTDHAGIETQYVFEKEVLKPQGKTRFDLGPEEFYRQLWDYTRKSENIFLNQFRSMGFSADWSRLQFTLNEEIVKTVYATFKQMHEDGLIYRGNRIVNWCPSCQAAFADIELDHTEREDALYTLDYGTIHIATTRPETIFADVAVAVNPDDDRFNGKLETATIPLINRIIPIIKDAHVDPEFGTGGLKVTPAHDKNDYEIGIRHGLPEISVVDLEGKMINVPEQFAGLPVFDARKAVVSELEKAGKLIETKPLTHAVAIHDRCGTVIEPLVTEQWYVRVKPLIEPTVKAIEEGRVEIIPARFKKIALDWMGQEHDWNISRQIWWGIRIPVYYKTSNDPGKEAYIVAETEQEAMEYYGEGNYRPETDTFDTWFSSGQWPFATLQATGDFDRFYPTTVMETGRDILTKWVTKMIWFGLYRTGKVPFKNVYLHGLVTDSQGRKMSKSKGNGLDPLEMTAKYGTDALRLALTIGITPGNDGSLSETKIEGYRNFCNKLWNVSRFITETVGDSKIGTEPVPSTLADEWILTKIAAATAEITAAIEDYRFSDAGSTLYELVWSNFADWYIEASKVSPNLSVLTYGLTTILKLSQPLAPFVSEAIWQKLPWTEGQLITAEWPDIYHVSDQQRKSAAEFDEIISLIEAVRAAATKLSLQKPTLIIKDQSSAVQAQAALITRLARLEKIETSDEKGLLLTSSGMPAYLRVDAGTLEKYSTKLQEELNQKEEYAKRLENQLQNKTYVSNAPKAIVAETRKKLADTQVEIKVIKQELEEVA